MAFGEKRQNIQLRESKLRYLFSMKMEIGWLIFRIDHLTKIMEVKKVQGKTFE